MRIYDLPLWNGTTTSQLAVMLPVSYVRIKISSAWEEEKIRHVDTFCIWCQRKKSFGNGESNCYQSKLNLHPFMTPKLWLKLPYAYAKRLSVTVKIKLSITWFEKREDRWCSCPITSSNQVITSSNEKKVQVPNTAVLLVATWGRLQMWINLHRLSSSSQHLIACLHCGTETVLAFTVPLQMCLQMCSCSSLVSANLC